MSAHAQPRLTPEEYLEIERAAQFRSEYYNGRMYAMSGGTYRHSTLISNLLFRLRLRLQGGPCAVTSSDFRLNVAEGGMYSYPDVLVARFIDKRRDTLINPSLIIEVLSPSTEVYDRGLKGTKYRTVESLQEYVLVSQNETRVELYRRQSSGWHFEESVGLESVCYFSSVDCTLQLSDIYENISFDDEDAS